MDALERDVASDTLEAFKAPFASDALLQDEATTPGGEIIKPNDSVEFQDGSFMRIIFIMEQDNAKIQLHGYQMLRNEAVDKKYSQRLGHNLKALLPCRNDEICAIVKTTSDTDAIDAYLIIKPLEDVVRKRRIIVTNVVHTWSDGQLASNESLPDDQAQLAGALTCKWKYVEKIDVQKRKVTAFQIRRITMAESDPEHGIHPCYLLQQYQTNAHRSKQLNIEYSYGDICAGGGGASQAAVLAGLKPRFLLDNDPNACETLSLNFGPDVVIEEDVCVFSQLKETGLVVDVVHYSYVCCAHSAANRHTNPERDADNVALAYTLSDILKLCKPRVVTMVRSFATRMSGTYSSKLMCMQEQVPGIEKRSDDGQHLRSYIQALTENGYECRWRVVNFGQYSNVQARKRIIIFAACPGQQLPSWPEPTNGSGRRLPDPVTIEEALFLVPDNLRNHMLQHTAKRNVVHPDPKQPLKGCITTSGGSSDVHPYEDRSFNMAELAALNGFPPWHEFPSHLGVTALRRIIGNAVPALSFRHFFDKVVKSLRETDEEHEEYEMNEGHSRME